MKFVESLKKFCDFHQQKRKKLNSCTLEVSRSRSKKQKKKIHHDHFLCFYPMDVCVVDNETIHLCLLKLAKKKLATKILWRRKRKRRVDLWYLASMCIGLQEVSSDKSKSLKIFFDLWSDKHKKRRQQKILFMLLLFSTSLDIDAY